MCPDNERECSFEIDNQYFVRCTTHNRNAPAVCSSAALVLRAERDALRRTIAEMQARYDEAKASIAHYNELYKTQEARVPELEEQVL